MSTLTTPASPSTRTAASATLAGATLSGGGISWVLAGIIGDGAASGSSRFYASEVTWLAAQVLLLVGFVTLIRLRPHGTLRLGRVGAAISVAGRIVFVAAELLALASGDDENALLPLGALLTAAGGVAFGIAVVRAQRWRTPARWTPLAFGAYPVALMFPLLALTGAPPERLIVGWGAAAALLGIATLRAEQRPTQPAGAVS